MEIYKELNSPKNKEFETLLNSQLSKTKIQEGNVVVGTVTKITEKYIFLYIDGLKSEPVIDINEVKSINIQDNLKEGSKISVFLEKIEDSKGDVIVSAAKAQKIKGWKLLEKAYENNEPIIGKIKSKVKEEPINVFNEAINNIKPTVEVRSRRVGGATYQVPVEVKSKRSQALALRWLIDASRKRKDKKMSDKIFNEIFDAYQNKGSAIKKKEDTHKMAESNKAFAHFRW